LNVDSWYRIALEGERQGSLVSKSNGPMIKSLPPNTSLFFPWCRSFIGLSLQIANVALGHCVIRQGRPQGSVHGCQIHVLIF